MGAAPAEGRPPACADPAVAPVVALLLLPDPLLEEPHQLLEVEVLHGGDLLRAEIQQPLGLLQPAQDLLVELRRLDLHALEVVGEDPIEQVVLGLALDQQGAGDVVEGREVGVVQPHGERAHQSEPLLGADLEPVAPQRVEELDQHLPDRAPLNVGSQPPDSDRAPA